MRLARGGEEVSTANRVNQSRNMNQPRLNGASDGDGRLLRDGAAQTISTTLLGSEEEENRMQFDQFAAPMRRRVMIFIDGSNLYHVLKQNTDKHDLDYKRFSEKLTGDRELIRTYYYNIRQESPDNPKLAENQDRFLNALYETDYLEVKLGIWKARGGTMVEKGVDVMIASDLIMHAYEDHYDVAILVSGDADFYPALQAVKDIGKQVEVAAFDSNLSAEAARLADVVTKFNGDYFDELWMSRSRRQDFQRVAALRERVSDEDSSPNGEDKGANRNGDARNRNGSTNGNGRYSAPRNGRSPQRLRPAYQSPSRSTERRRPISTSHGTTVVRDVSSQPASKPEEELDTSRKGWLSRWRR